MLSLNGISVAKGPLLNWEQGRRPYQMLLALIAKKPDLVRDLLS